MDLNSTTTANVRLLAALEEDGSLTLKATAHAEYAKGKVVSVDVTNAVFDPEALEAVRSAMKTALNNENVQRTLALHMQRATVTTTLLAEQRGELR